MANKVNGSPTPTVEKNPKNGGRHQSLITRKQYHVLFLIRFLDGAWNWNGEILQGRHW